MKIVIAIDSMKGCLSSRAAGEAVREGIRRVFPDAEIRVFSVADGGEGTTDALVTALNGAYRSLEVLDPLGRTIPAQYGILPDGTAVLEMAAASGLALLTEAERNPWITTTYGFGQMIADAVQNGCRNLILGIGGSATNDGGIGCLQALGFSMESQDGTPVSFGAAGLTELSRIDESRKLAELSACSVHVACDVRNPLCGPEGCSAVFGAQKGADAVMIANMEQGMQHFAKLTQREHPSADPEMPGAGAAGGLGYALFHYLHAKPEPGIGLVLKQIKIEKAIRDADVVITGEGCLDAQTVMGKAPAGIAGLAKQYQKTVIAFCGVRRNGAEICNENGIDAYFPILHEICTASEAMMPEYAEKNLSDTAEQVFRLVRCLSGRS